MCRVEKIYGDDLKVGDVLHIYSAFCFAPSASAAHQGTRISTLTERILMFLVRMDQISNLLAVPAPFDEPDEIRAVWGTAVNLAETPKLFP